MNALQSAQLVDLLEANEPFYDTFRVSGDMRGGTIVVDLFIGGVLNGQYPIATDGTIDA